MTGVQTCALPIYVIVFEFVLVTLLAPLVVGAISPNDNEPAAAPTVTRNRSLCLNCMLILPPRTTEMVTSNLPILIG